MCLSPITIPNQTKYISTKHKDLFLMQVPCGHCAECQKTMSNHWYYRAWYEWQDLDNAGGFVLFDTLTYAPKYLPHISDTWSCIEKKDDYPCFSYHHIRKFMQSLMQRVKRAGYGSCIRYFLSSEYGTHEYKNGKKLTHRPHYHLLLYVYNNQIDPLWLSKQISDLWYYGRTDGIPYKSKRYVLGKNIVSASDSLGCKLRTCHYVTKYVQKSCQFDKQIQIRKNKVMFALANIADPVTPDKWLETEAAHRESLKLNRLVNQFHRQSQHFGESALADIDLNQLVRDGCLYMPDFRHIKIPIPLPMYYKRKLCFELVEFNGSRYWIPNEFGKEFTKLRKEYSFPRLVDRYSCVVKQHNLSIDPECLARYVMYERGRIIGELPECSLDERIDEIDFINYSSSSDKLNFGCRGLSDLWQGDSQQGYESTHLFNRISFSQFISKYVYFNPELEKQLDLLLSKMSITNRSKQDAFELRQDLTEKYKLFV